VAPRVIGNPGESAAIRGGLLALLLIAGIAVFMVLPAWWAIAYYSQKWGFLGLLAGLSAILVAYRWRRRDLLELADALRESRAWLKGAKGEYLVDRELAKLSGEFIVFHDYHPCGPDGKRVRWNVDHIVVGPTGVFVLDAKNYGRQRVPTADSNRYSKKNVDQAQRNALDLKKLLKTWSNAALAEVFVVPTVVYVQEGAHVDQLREGAVRVLPLRLLVGDILRHTESQIDLERSGRVAMTLFSQLPVERRMPFKSEIAAYLQLTTADRRTSAREAIADPASAPQIPVVCPLCGAALVRRTARHGERAGKPFLGCANYRKTGCKYGFNLD